MYNINVSYNPNHDIYRRKHSFHYIYNNKQIITFTYLSSISFCNLKKILRLLSYNRYFPFQENLGNRLKSEFTKIK